jgi:hypothetical protein
MHTGLSYAFTKDVQNVIHECITLPKKSKNGKQVWDKACIDLN